MSWEGYQQNICKNGHLFCGEGEYLECPYCGNSIVWWNLVDETNGAFEVDECGNQTGVRIDGYVQPEVNTSEETCVCSTCCHQHISKQATYKIPEDVGHKV